jgi:hypothetical protein
MCGSVICRGPEQARQCRTGALSRVAAVLGREADELRDLATSIAVG